MIDNPVEDCFFLRGEAIGNGVFTPTFRACVFGQSFQQLSNSDALTMYRNLTQISNVVASIYDYEKDMRLSI